MTLDQSLLEKKLREHLPARLRLRKRGDGVLMIDTPFTFADGDHYSYYVSETSSGSVLLSDRGHTLMHISHEDDEDSEYDGARAVARKFIVRDFDIQEDDGVFSVETAPDQITDTVLRFGLAIRRIYDVSSVRLDE